MSPAELKSSPYQPLTFVFGAAVSGILADRFYPIPWNVWGTIIFVAIIAWIIFSRIDRSNISTGFLLLAIAAGFGCWHHAHWNRFSANDPGFFAVKLGGPACLRGTLAELPRLIPAPPDDPTRPISQKERTLFTLHADHLRDADHWIPVDGYISVNVEGDRSELRYGDRLELFGNLSKPTPPQNPSDHDYTASLRNLRILSILRVPSPDSVNLLEHRKFSIGGLLESVRRAGRTNLERCMNPKNAARATAMILGMREGVDEETTQSLLDTGTLHILAISGLHVGLLAVIVVFLLQLFGISRRRSAFVLIAVVLVYLFLTDVRPPAIRATVLVCVVATAMLSSRRSLAVNTLCATAIVVLAINPSELFQFGAQLSFIATGGFLWAPTFPKRLYFGPNQDKHVDEESLDDVEELEPQRWWIVRIIEKTILGAANLFTISVIIWFISTPLILERIHLFTPVAVLVNPLLWFPLTAAMSFGFATMIFGAIPILGNSFGWFADISFDMLFGMIAFFQRLGGHYWMPGPPVWWIVAFYVAFILWTFFPLPRPKPRTTVVILVAWIMVGVLAEHAKIAERYWNDRLTVSICSVGHGSGVLIITPTNRTIIYDAGCFSSPKRSGDVLSRALWRAGKTSIDAIVLSHADSDHYNGVLTLAERFHVKMVFVSPYMFEKDDPGLDLLRKTLVEKSIPLQQIGDGDDLSSTGIFESKFLHPPKENFSDRARSNACSIVFTFKHRDFRLLLPADLDGRTTPPFLKRPPLHCNAVMVPHHGGKSLLTEQLIQWTSPKHLIVSGGHFSRNEALLEDLKRRGFTLHSTFDDGAIELSVDKHGEFWKHYLRH